MDIKSAKLYADQEMKYRTLKADHWFQDATGRLPQGTGAPVVNIPPRPRAQASRAGGGSRAGNITVTDPKGGVHTFSDQQSADNFKKAAGIK